MFIQPYIPHLAFKLQDLETLLNELRLCGYQRAKVCNEVVEILLGEEITEEKVFDGVIKASGIPRFENIAHMISRDYVGVHQERVGAMVQSVEPFLDKKIDRYNSHYAITLAYFHDDIEGISPFGDIATNIKMNLSPQSQKIVYTVEKRIGGSIKYHLFSRIFRKSYRQDTTYPDQIITDIIEKQSIESKVVSYLDKLDGLLTCFHELCLGNTYFREPFLRYIEIFKKISAGEYLAEIHDLLGKDGHEYFDIDSIIEQGDRISEFYNKSESAISGFKAYDVWRYTS